MSKKIPSGNQSGVPHSPFIFTLIKKCSKYKIPYELMCRLNYNDLLYLVVEYDISSMEQYLQQKTQMERNKRGIDVVDATPEMATDFFKGGR